MITVSHVDLRFSSVLNLRKRNPSTLLGKTAYAIGKCRWRGLILTQRRHTDGRIDRIHADLHGSGLQDRNGGGADCPCMEIKGTAALVTVRAPTVTLITRGHGPRRRFGAEGAPRGLHKTRSAARFPDRQLKSGPSDRLTPPHVRQVISWGCAAPLRPG